MKKKLSAKRVVWLVLGLGAVAAIAFLLLRPKTEPVSYQRAAPLAVMDLKSTVDVTGTVASEHNTTVHSTLGEPVTEIAVEVGDWVEEGQLLCKLDTTAIESDITAKESAISTAARGNQMRLNQANTDLGYAQWYLEREQNAGILAAQQAVESAERSVKSAKFAVRTAEDNYDEARSANYEADADLYSDAQMNQLRDAISNAHLNLEEAEANLDAAKQRQKRATWDAGAQLKELEDAVQSAQNAADQTADYIALQKLKDNLADCIITAPVSGTVTAVYAKEGAEARGLLFVIESIEELVVETTVKEFDINAVELGMPVEIKSDATGSRIFEGELFHIDPASLKNAAGETLTGTTAEYGAKVRVTTPDSGLKIGMNARLNIILEQRGQALAVLFDSVSADAQGNAIVYVARPRENGSYIARAVPVELGMETDLYLEVSGELAEGDLILQDPAALYDGMPVELMPEIAAGSTGGMGHPTMIRVG